MICVLSTFVSDDLLWLFCESQKFDALQMLPSLRVLIVDLDGGLGILPTLDNEEAVVRQVFSKLLVLDYLECHRHHGIAPGRKYIIDRGAQEVTVYAIPGIVLLSVSEGSDVSVVSFFENAVNLSFIPSAFAGSEGKAHTAG